MKLLLATTSRGKIREQRRSLDGLDVDLEIVTLDPWPDLAPPQEPGPGFPDNARAKALYYHQETGLPAVGEDSGLEVDALGGEPGVRSARWLGESTPFEVKNARILEELEGRPESERSARYVSAVALASGGRVVFEAQASCEGRIAAEPAGSGGFGYDPIFFYPPFGRTLAEVTAEEKNRISHRGKAMAALKRYLLEELRRSVDDPPEDAL